MPITAVQTVKEKPPSRAHRTYFTFAITCISRYMILRDRVFGLSKKGRLPVGIHERALRQPIASAASRLDAVFVEPVSFPAHAALLLCHGIGETVEQWFGVQQLLAANGVASLVFDYSGYGKSTGRPDWDQFEQDAIAAFAALQELAPGLPASVLGFSLGSGVATATINSLDAHRLILCEAFTSFRGAATGKWVPKGLTRLVPPIWHAQDQLCKCKLPVLIVHGEKDRMFPAGMAAELAAFCSPAAKVLLILKTTHNQPFRSPHLNYWGPIIAWLGK
jgi:pimeloyl-ACP methyl ester carboxylesterase